MEGHSWFISFPFLVGRKLQCQTQQRDGVQLLVYFLRILGGRRPVIFPSRSWWVESCSVRLSRGMVCSRQPRRFQGVDSHGRPDGWTEGWRDGWQDARIQGRLHFSSRHPLIYVMFGTSWWPMWYEPITPIYPTQLGCTSS